MQKRPVNRGAAPPHGSAKGARDEQANFPSGGLRAAAALLTGCGASGTAASSSAAQDMMSSESMAAGGAESALLPEDVSTAENAQS